MPPCLDATDVTVLDLTPSYWAYVHLDQAVSILQCSRALHEDAAAVTARQPNTLTEAKGYDSQIHGSVLGLS
jgi:hypothetical protein